MRFITTGPVPDVVSRLLSSIAPVELAEAVDEQSLVERAPGTVGFIVRGDTRLTETVIRAASDLKVIGRPGIGYDNVDVHAATERGIPVVIAPGAVSVAAAEATRSALLALVKRTVEFDRLTRAGQWSVRHTPTGDLAGATLGLVGFGSIGREVAKRALAFDMTVIAFDPFVSADVAASCGVTLTDLDSLLRQSDVVSLHLGLTKDTAGLIDRRALTLMKKGALLLNFARGGLFANLDDIDAALRAGDLGGLGLDVYPKEPPDVSHPIFSNPRALLSPHTGGLSARGAENAARMMSEGMIAVLEGKRPSNVANPEAYARGR